MISVGGGVSWLWFSRTDICQGFIVFMPEGNGFLQGLLIRILYFK